MEVVVYYSLVAAGLGAMWWKLATSARKTRLLGTRFSEEADIVLHVARHAAQSRGGDLSTLCILYGLLQDETITSAITVAGGDPEVMEDRVLAALEDDTSEDEYAEPVLTWLVHVAAAHERSVTCVDMWAALSNHAPGPAGLMSSGDIWAADVLAVLVHGKLDRPAPSGRVAVVAINDDFTTQEVVVEIFAGVFELERKRAAELMLKVHNEGSAPVAVLEADLAEELVTRAEKIARDAGYPLTFRYDAV